MSTNVTVTRYGQIHYIAGCNECDFSDAICAGHSRAAVRRAVRQHVAKTGHTAWIEAGTHTAYEKSRLTSIAGDGATAASNEDGPRNPPRA